MIRATGGLIVLVSLLATGCSDPSNDLFGNTSHGSVSVDFGDESQSNLNPSHIHANEVTVLLHDVPTGTLALYVAGFRHEGGDSYAKEWQLSIGLTGEPSSGKTYAIDPAKPAGAPDTATLRFEEDVLGTALWSASGGSITVRSLVSRRATISLDAVTLAPQELGAMGTFSMSGTITIADIDNVCDCID